MRRNMWRMSRSGRETRCGPKSEGDIVVAGIALSFIQIRMLWLSVYGDDVIGMNFGNGALGPVPVMPFAVTQRPFDEGAAALVKNFRELRRGLLPKDHTVPFRSLMLLAAAIDPRFGGCHPEGQDGISLCRKSKLRISSEAAKQHDLVDADAHPSTSSYSAMVRLVETWLPPFVRSSSSACFSTCLSFSPVFCAYSLSASRRRVFVMETSAAAPATSSPKCSRRIGSAFSPTMLSRDLSTGPSIRPFPSGIGSFSARA